MRSMLLLFLLSCLLNSCGLSRYGIKEAWVFTEEKFRGNIQVDEHGTPVTKGVMVETTVFFETKEQDLPSFTLAEINGKSYKVKESMQVKSPYPIGKNKADETPVTITIARDHFLYRIVIESFDPSENSNEINGLRLVGESPEGKISIRLDKKAVQLLPQMVP
jgi:hypothetical protein